MMTIEKNEMVKVILKKSPIGCTPTQRACVRGLGLRKLGSSRALKRTPATMGMVNKVRFLLEVVEA